MMKLNHAKIVALLTLTIMAQMMLPLHIAHAQSRITLECGDIVESETSADQPIDQYTVSASAGTTLNITVEPIGSTFNPVLIFHDAAGNHVQTFNSETAGLTEKVSNFVISSSNPTLYIVGDDGRFTRLYDLPSWYTDTIGAYVLYMGCTLRDGTDIEPGDPPSDDNETKNNSNETNETSDTPESFSGVGFPGLAPKDFSDGVTIPFTMAAPNAGAINPGFDSVFGFTFSGSSGDLLDLSFARVSGNLNLGLAVLGPENQIAFQASLVTSDSLSTRFTLPGDGEYTIGVFRIDLVPPDSPQNTAFQITGTLNP